jgi:hypothetical protein
MFTSGFAYQYRFDFDVGPQSFFNEPDAFDTEGYFAGCGRSGERDSESLQPVVFARGYGFRLTSS